MSIVCFDSSWFLTTVLQFLNMNEHSLSLYITAEHTCGYYDDRLSANLIPDPQILMSTGLYSLLVTKGFRRSGDFVYRPHCAHCEACVPCRIDVVNFQPNRNQRRCLKKNRDITTCVKNAEFSEEYFLLYRRYIDSRHGDGSMAHPQPDDFRHFLLSDWGHTLFIESRLNGELLGVAVCDYLPAGLSAVYTFFDPQSHQRSLGTFAILQQIWLAKIYDIHHIYLGYWIDKHPKMDYKRRFGALEVYQDMQWIPFITARKPALGLSTKT
jgi:arginine-tRNA-protein transferase